MFQNFEKQTLKSFAMKTTNQQVSDNGILNPNNQPAAQNDSVKTPGNESFEHAAHDPNPHAGSDALAEKYTINDKAHTDSSEKDFIKTVSNFNHSTPEDTSTDSRNHS